MKNDLPFHSSLELTEVSSLKSFKSDSTFNTPHVVYNAKQQYNENNKSKLHEYYETIARLSTDATLGSCNGVPLDSDHMTSHIHPEINCSKPYINQFNNTGRLKIIKSTISANDDYRFIRVINPDENEIASSPCAEGTGRRLPTFGLNSSLKEGMDYNDNESLHNLRYYTNNPDVTKFCSSYLTIAEDPPLLNEQSKVLAKPKKSIRFKLSNNSNDSSALDNNWRAGSTRSNIPRKKSLSKTEVKTILTKLIQVHSEKKVM